MKVMVYDTEKGGAYVKAKNVIKAAKLGYIFISIIIMAIGIMMIIKPLESSIVFCDIVGALFIIFGIVKIAGYCSKDLYRLAFQYDLAFGILMIIIGCIMLLHPGGIIKFFNIALGILILSDGLFKIQLSMDAKEFGIQKWWIILTLAILTGSLGAILICVPEDGMKAIAMLLGLSFVAEGFLNLLVSLYAVEVIRRKGD